MSRVERDLERGRAVAAELKTLGVKKRELIRAAEQGYITELACKMPKCFCPEELGGASYFAQVTNDWSDWRSDWMPTLEHFPVYKKDGGRAAVDKISPNANARMFVFPASNACNRSGPALVPGDCKYFFTPPSVFELCNKEAAASKMAGEAGLFGFCPAEPGQYFATTGPPQPKR